MEEPLKRRDGSVWSDSSRLQLLAYLNWCATYRENLLPTAQDHLKRVTGNNYTRTQIRRRLYFEWEKYGLCKNFNEVFTQGTPSLNLSDQEQNEIQSIFTSLLHRPHELRSNSWEARTRSRAAPKTVKTPTAKGRAIRLKVTNNNSPTSREAIPHLLDYSPDDEGDGDDSVNLIQVAHAESEFGEPSSPRPSFRSAPRSRSPPSIRSPTEQLSDDIAALQDEVLKLKGHNLTLQNRVSELEANRAEIRHLRNSTNGDIDYCTQMVFNFEKRVNAMSAHLQNVADSEMGRLGLPESTIAEEYKELYLSILGEAQSFCGNDDSPRIRNDDENAHPARGWAMTASGWDLCPLLCHYNNEKVPSSRLVAALVTAGIFDLVFEHVFPDILSVECPLTNGYRRHILAKDGSEGLHLADLAALESLRLSNDSIKEPMIEEKAKYLSEFMLQSLNFCITEENHQVTNPDDDSDMEEAPADGDLNMEEVSTDDDSGIKEAPLSLEIPLREALNLKLSLTTSMKRLKFFFFWPGHDFDAASMEKDDMSSDGTVVKLCLLPALFSVPRDWLDTRLEESRWEVDSHFDKYLTEATEEEVASLRLVAKAVVLT